MLSLAPYPPWPLIPLGLDNVQGEWTLVCLAWNLKRMAVLRLN